MSISQRYYPPDADSERMLREMDRGAAVGMRRDALWRAMAVFNGYKRKDGRVSAAKTAERLETLRENELQLFLQVTA